MKILLPLIVLLACGCAKPPPKVDPQVAVQLASLEPAPHAPRGRVSDRFPNIRLVTHEGRVVSFYDDLIKDRKVLINFIYTKCNGI